MTHHTRKIKGKKTHTYISINFHERNTRLTECTAVLSQTSGHSASFTENSSNIILSFYTYFYFNLQTKVTGSWIRCNILVTILLKTIYIWISQHVTLRYHNRSNTLELPRNRLLWWVVVAKLVLLDPSPRHLLLRWFKKLGLHENFLTINVIEPVEIKTIAMFTVFFHFATQDTDCVGIGVIDMPW